MQNPEFYSKNEAEEVLIAQHGDDVNYWIVWEQHDADTAEEDLGSIREYAMLCLGYNTRTNDAQDDAISFCPSVPFPLAPNPPGLPTYALTRIHGSG